jgi:hypothetical protein
MVEDEPAAHRPAYRRRMIERRGFIRCLLAGVAGLINAFPLRAGIWMPGAR